MLMLPVGERGYGKFKHVSWDEALDHVAEKTVPLKNNYGLTVVLDRSYADASYNVVHKSDQIKGLLASFLGMFGSRTGS